MNYKDLEQKFDISKKMRKNNIRKEPKKFKRFWLGVGYYLTYPFEGIGLNLKDGKTAVIFIIVMAVVSSEVGVLYLIGLLTGGTGVSAGCLGLASTLGLWWMLPGTPFLPLCIGITIGIKALINKKGKKPRGEK